MKELAFYVMASVLRLRRITAELDTAQAVARTAVLTMAEGPPRVEPGEHESEEQFMRRLDEEVVAARRRAARGIKSRDRRVRKVASYLRFAAGMALVGAMAVGRMMWEGQASQHWELPYVPLPEVSSARMALDLVPDAGKEKTLKLASERWVLRRSPQGSDVLRTLDSVRGEVRRTMSATAKTLPASPWWMGDAANASEHIARLELLHQFGDSRRDETLGKLDEMIVQLDEIQERTEDDFDPLIELGGPLADLLRNDVTFGTEAPATKDAAAHMKEALAAVGIEVTVEKNVKKN